jgi:hypothetical protein
MMPSVICMCVQQPIPPSGLAATEHTPRSAITARVIRPMYHWQAGA